MKSLKSVTHSLISATKLMDYNSSSMFRLSYVFEYLYLKPLHFGLHVVLRPRRLLLAFLDARLRLLHGALRVAANVGGAQMHLQLHRTQEAAVDVPDEATDGAVDSLLSVLCL